jgi:hypothetical protein
MISVLVTQQGPFFLSIVSEKAWALSASHTKKGLPVSGGRPFFDRPAGDISLSAGRAVFYSSEYATGFF